MCARVMREGRGEVRREKGGEGEVVDDNDVDVGVDDDDDD